MTMTCEFWKIVERQKGGKIKLVVFTIPSEPFGKQRPRFTRFGRAYTPKSTQDYERYVRSCYGDGVKFDCPVAIEILATHAIPASFSRKKRDELDGQAWAGKPDADNIAKAVLDGLNGVAYGDDSQITTLTVVKRYGTQGSVTVTIRTD